MQPYFILCAELCSQSDSHIQWYRLRTTQSLVHIAHIWCKTRHLTNGSLIHNKSQKGKHFLWWSWDACRNVKIEKKKIKNQQESYAVKLVNQTCWADHFKDPSSPSFSLRPYTHWNALPIAVPWTDQGSPISRRSSCSSSHRRYSGHRHPRPCSTGYRLSLRNRQLLRLSWTDPPFHPPDSYSQQVRSRSPTPGQAGSSSLRHPSAHLASPLHRARQSWAGCRLWHRQATALRAPQTRASQSHSAPRNRGRHGTGEPGCWNGSCRPRNSFGLDDRTGEECNCLGSGAPGPLVSSGPSAMPLQDQYHQHSRGVQWPAMPFAFHGMTFGARGMRGLQWWHLWQWLTGQLCAWRRQQAPLPASGAWDVAH